MHVLQATLNPPDKSKPLAMASEMKLWVGQDDLFLHRRTVTNRWLTATATLTFECRNLKVDAKLDPALFKYTPPEGAVVTDKTNQTDK